MVGDRNRPTWKESTMSKLKALLREEMTDAMKAGHKLTRDTLRSVLGEIETREKSGKAPVQLTDPQIETLLRKEAAKRRDTARIYTEAAEAGRANQEINEALIIEGYLPDMLTGAEVFQIIDKAISQVTKETGEKPGVRQIGPVMKLVTAEVAGRFDGKQVAGLVKARLG